MAHYHVKKSVLSGEVDIPTSKSHTLRAILFGALGKGKTVIHHALASPDAKAMVDACRHLGAKITSLGGTLIIDGVNGKINHAQDVIQAGNSGLVLRMIAAVAALSEHPIVLTGDDSIRHNRPMKPLLDALGQLGVSAISTKGNGFAPVIIKGPLKPGKTIVNGEDSQPVTALLIASIFAAGPIEIEVRNPGEKPWIDLTLAWLKRLGITCEHRDYTYYRMEGNGSYPGFDYTVPGDWSSAAFPLSAALVTGSEITLNHVDDDVSQGDRAIVQALRKMGACIEIDPRSRQLHVKKRTRLKGADLDINDYVDAITILAAVACYAEGETRIRNASVARQKECNRISCIANELRKMGADITEHEDGLTIRGSQLRGARVASHQDHRMAMSLAVAGMGAEGLTEIQEVQCVSKTFPGFAAGFIQLGAQLKEVS